VTILELMVTPVSVSTLTQQPAEAGSRKSSKERPKVGAGWKLPKEEKVQVPKLQPAAVSKLRRVHSLKADPVMGVRLRVSASKKERSLEELSWKGYLSEG